MRYTLALLMAAALAGGIAAAAQDEKPPLKLVFLQRAAMCPSITPRTWRGKRANARPAMRSSGQSR